MTDQAAPPPAGADPPPAPDPLASLATPPAATAAAVARPEQVVVAHPPPDPDYPRYRVTPAQPIRLRAFNPDESEHYTHKQDVAEELAKQRKRITQLQERLYAEHRQSLLIVLHTSRGHRACESRPAPTQSARSLRCATYPRPAAPTRS